MSNSDLIISQIRQRLEILYQMVDELESGGGGGGGGGTTDYNDLSNKPSIGGVQLVGNKTLSQLGAATPSDITDAFTPSTISLVEGGTFPSDSRNLLTEHKPVMVNDVQYQFLEESGIDYLYSATPTSGAYPTISYLRVMKNSYSVEFHVTEIDTVPTADSTNLITSGAVATGLAGKQATLSTAQQNAVNSGITSSKVSSYDAIVSGNPPVSGRIFGSGNLNNATTSGYYKYTGSPSNHPTTEASEFGMLVVFSYDSYVSQFCHVYNGTGGLYIRRSSDAGATWTSWAQL